MKGIIQKPLTHAPAPYPVPTRLYTDDYIIRNISVAESTELEKYWKYIILKEIVGLSSLGQMWVFKQDLRCHMLYSYDAAGYHKFKKIKIKRLEGSLHYHCLLSADQALSVKPVCLNWGAG